MGVALKDFIDDIGKFGELLIGVTSVNELIKGDIPEKIMQYLEPFIGWSVLVVGLPIKEEAEWLWIKRGETRLLFANYFLERVTQHLRARSVTTGVDIISVSERFTGVISLVELAEHAGLGQRGINNLLITPRYGAWVQLEGYLLNMSTDAVEERMASPCVECMNCVEACPAKAISTRDFRPAACSQFVASPLRTRSRAVAFGNQSYIECAACITSCPIGRLPQRLER